MSPKKARQKFGERFPSQRGEGKIFLELDELQEPLAEKSARVLPAPKGRTNMFSYISSFSLGRASRPTRPPHEGWRPSHGGTPASLLGTAGGRVHAQPGQRPILGTGTNRFRPARPTTARRIPESGGSQNGNKSESGGAPDAREKHLGGEDPPHTRRARAALCGGDLVLQHFL